jgi:hypothetical protein
MRQSVCCINMPLLFDFANIGRFCDIAKKNELLLEPKSVIRPTFISFLAFSGLFMPYQHFFRHLVHIPVSP